MIVDSTRLGSLQVDARELIQFPSAFSGLPDWKEGVLVPVSGASHLFWLQFTHDCDAAFLLIELQGLLQGFDFNMVRQAAKAAEHAKIYAIVRVPNGDFMQATINLLAPVVIQQDANLEGQQVILHESSYPIRHPLFVEEEPC